MRKFHELEKGVICERCLKLVKNKQYKRINSIELILTDTTVRCKTIDRINFCNDCYTLYKECIENFKRKR